MRRSRLFEQYYKHFTEARDKLDRWAEDLVASAEHAIWETKEKLKVLKRTARQAATLPKQHQLQQEIQTLEKHQRRQRQEIFAVEDEIEGKRDDLISALERRMAQQTSAEVLFTIRWAVV